MVAVRRHEAVMTSGLVVSSSLLHCVLMLWSLYGQRDMTETSRLVVLSLPNAEITAPATKDSQAGYHCYTGKLPPLISCSSSDK